MASLHEGVFLERSHAEAYVSIFQNQMDDFEEGGQTDNADEGTRKGREICHIRRIFLYASDTHDSYFFLHIWFVYLFNFKLDTITVKIHNGSIAEASI